MTSFAVEPTTILPGYGYLVRDLRDGYVARRSAARSNGGNRLAYFRTRIEARQFAAQAERRAAKTAGSSAGEFARRPRPGQDVAPLRPARGTHLTSAGDTENHHQETQP